MVHMVVRAAALPMNINADRRTILAQERFHSPDESCASQPLHAASTHQFRLSQQRQGWPLCNLESYSVVQKTSFPVPT